MPSPGSSSSEPFYCEVSADALLQQQHQLLLQQQQHQQLAHQPLAGPSTSLLQSVAGPGSANGSEDTRDKDGKLKRTREGCYTCRNRKKKCDQVRPICGSCSRLSFTCEFPPQIVNADGQLVTVRQPNKRKKDRSGTAGAAGGSGAGAGGSADGQSEGSLEAKKRVKTQTGPRPPGKAPVLTAASTSGGAGQNGIGGGGVGPSPTAGLSSLKSGLGGPSASHSVPSYLASAAQRPPGHHRTYSTASSGIDQAVRPVFQNGSGGNGHPDHPYPQAEGQYLQQRAMSSSSQGSASSGFSLRQNYNPDQLQGSPNMPTSLLAHDSSVGGPLAVSHATPASNAGDGLSVNGGGGCSYQASSDGGTGSIRDRFDHMVALQSSPMQAAVPNIAFDAPPGQQQQQQPPQQPPQQQQQQQRPPPSHASIAGTPDLFSRPFSPFSASANAAVGNDPEAHNRMLQEMHRQFQQSFQQPTAAPSPSFSEWMKSFGDTMDSPGQIFGDAALKPSSNGMGGNTSGSGGLDVSGFRPNVNGSQADSPMTWLAPSPAPSSLHLGMSQTPVYQHSHLHPALQSSPLHQSQTPLQPLPPLAPTNGTTGLSQQTQQHQLNFDGSRLGNGGAHFTSSAMAPPRKSGQHMSPPQISGPSASNGLAMNAGNRSYATSSHGTGGGSQHHVSPPEVAWQTESLDPGYGPSAFIEPIPDENDSDTRDFINGYTDGGPLAAGASGPGSPIVRAGPNRSVTVSSRLAPPITIKLPELPQMIADQAPLLIDYFVRKLSPLISVLSPRKNAGAFQPASVSLVGGSDIASVFVPMASQSKLMLLSVLGWSSMHLHELGEPWREIADLLRTQLVDRVENAFIAWEEKKGPHTNDEEMLASLVALSEIEICRGSTSKWYRPLIMARQVIRRIGGADKIRKLNYNTKWLLQNWAYHSLLSSTDCLDGPSLEPDEYAAILCGGLSSFMGPSMIVFQILAETSRLSVEAAHCIHSDRDKRIEALRVLAAKDARLKARLDAVYPEFPPSEDLTTPETSYHLAAFRCFVLTARLYLRQVVSHCNAHSLVTQLLVNQLLANIGNVVGTPAESSLLFPLFITGVDATTESDRKIIKGHFLVIDNNCRIGNIQTAYALLEAIWDRNDFGERWVDWPRLSRELGWNVSFA